jgi:hypothetical protein
LRAGQGQTPTARSIANTAVLAHPAEVQPALVILGFVVAAGVLLYNLDRLIAWSALSSKPVRATLRELGCSREKGLFVGEFEGERFELLPPSDKQPARLRLPVPGVGCLIRVTKNHAVARFWTRTGLSRPIESGDASFDYQYYVDSPDRDFAAALLRQASVKAEIERMMSRKHFDIALRNERLIVKLERKVLSMPDGAARIRAELRESRGLAAEVRKATQGKTSPSRRWWPMSAILALSGLVLGIASAGVFIRTLGTVQLDDALAAFKLCKWISVGAFVGLQAVVAVLCAGRSNSHRLLLVSACTGVMAVPMLVFGLAFGGNAALDASPGRIVTVDVRKLEYDQKANKGKGAWDLFVDSWRKERKIDLVHPTPQEAVALKGATRAAIELHDGAFGWERILKIEPVIDR